MGTKVAAVGSTILNQQSAAADEYFHVMAVDDSIIDRKLIERLLKTSSYRVTTVDSGNKALQLLGLHDGDYEDQRLDRDEQQHQNISLHYHHHRHQEMEQVNMIITDYCMPGLTGYELLRKIKESEFLKDIPVVIMSSEYVPSRINRCLEEGAEEFFLKPVQMSDVSKLKPHLLRPKKNLYTTTPTISSTTPTLKNILKPVEQIHLPSPTLLL